MTARELDRRLRDHRRGRRQPRPHRGARSTIWRVHFPWLKVVHHAKNRGYGARCAPASRPPRRDLVFYTDGDAQYDPRELSSSVRGPRPDPDFVNGYKIAPHDPLHRLVIGRVYHWFVRHRLRPAPPGRGLRLPADATRASSHGAFSTRSSGVICVELMTKLQDHGPASREVPVHHFHRPTAEPVLQLSTGGSDPGGPVCSGR